MNWRRPPDVASWYLSIRFSPIFLIVGRLQTVLYKKLLCLYFPQRMQYVVSNIGWRREAVSFQTLNPLTIPYLRSSLLTLCTMVLVVGQHIKDPLFDESIRLFKPKHLFLMLTTSTCASAVIKNLLLK